uniref:F-actin monooxygenase n=1 Tax=Gouania willdenowi TaxID=441366 RepID=A0A8C5EQM9_GOUWI
MGETEDERTAQASQLFENFVQASTCKGTLQAFGILCRHLEVDPLDYSNFYSSLKAAVSSWKAQALWTKLDKRAQHKAYNTNGACQGTRCLIIGGGPCGLRTAIELSLLGCKVVVIEKRDTFSRNNVLHLWPFTIHDLRGLGAKKFYGKFCAGSIDHISIRQLQLMLLKVCLILGVEIHVNVEFVKLLEPAEEQTDHSPGWRAEIRPSTHPVSDFDFDAVIGADGRKNTLDGFRRKEFRGKLAIAITANFVNRNTTAEAKVEEISGVAFIFNQKFFLELKEETGIDLENIVYYKDHTHYFVMTAKKQSLLDKGVIIHDYIETDRLLSPDNVNQEALLSYAREAADFGTNYQLPSLDYAINHYGQPDVAMFDFTSMYASENAALIREKHGRQLLVALVGDSLLEPFWPMGTGCARGFLAAFDTAWMVRGWAKGRSALEMLAERESIYRLLPQTTTVNISKNLEQYTIDPASRYPNLNSSCVRPHQVRHLFIDGQQDSSHLERGDLIRRSVNLSRRESELRPGRLLTWCQKQTVGYRGVEVINLTSSWRNGLALCALIHHQKPEIIDFDSLNEEDVVGNNQLAFDVAEQHFGIQPVTTGKEMAAEAEPDKLLMVLYLSKFYEAFRNLPANNNGQSLICFVTFKVCMFLPQEDKKLEDDSVNKRRRKGNHYLTELSCHSAPPAGEDGLLRENKVRSMATRLQAKLEENSSTGKVLVRKGLGGSDICHFCSKRVYVMERLSAEGYFFHRECFRCNICNCTLRIGGHTFDSQEAKFYCKLHYAQRQSDIHQSRFRRRMVRSTCSLNSRTSACCAFVADFILSLAKVKRIVEKNCSAGEEKSHQSSAVTTDVCLSSSSKKRLMISQSDKEKLLNWEVVDKPSKQCDYKHICDCYLNICSLIFVVTRRSKQDNNRKRRPMSEGTFSLSSLFSAVTPDMNGREKRKGATCEPHWVSDGTNPWGSERDLPALLKRVSLKGRRDIGEVFSDDMSSRPRRRLDLFSSLRLKKRDFSEGDGNDQEVQQEIRTIFSNLRNKGWYDEIITFFIWYPTKFQRSLSFFTPLLQNYLKQGSLHPEKLKKKQERMVAQQEKRDQLKRLHRAQAIQRQLEEVGEKQRDLEERGVAIEKIIRGETDDHEEAHLYQSWFKLVLEKNRLARYESELMIFVQELELEDTQSRLQQDLRHRMAVEDTKKSASELQAEQELLSEIMRTVEKRDMLVSILDEQRLKERAEDKDLESLILSKGYEFHWAHTSDSGISGSPVSWKSQSDKNE